MTIQQRPCPPKLAACSLSQPPLGDPSYVPRGTSASDPSWPKFFRYSLSCNGRRQSENPFRSSHLSCSSMETTALSRRRTRPSASCHIRSASSASTTSASGRNSNQAEHGQPRRQISHPTDTGNEAKYTLRMMMRGVIVRLPPFPAFPPLQGFLPFPPSSTSKKDPKCPRRIGGHFLPAQPPTLSVE